MTGMPNMTDRFRRWFEYEKDSHAKVLASLQAVPVHLRNSDEYRKAMSLLAHILLARWLWLVRLGVAPPEKAPHRPEDFFPLEVSISDLPGQVAEMEKAWEAYLSSLDESEVSRVFEYRALDGAGFRNTIEDILTQLFGHSLYHRGQIAQLLRGLGAEPAVTDFVYWAREPIDVKL
jgi:uncharacterized damage-inducible protein DinB